MTHPNSHLEYEEPPYPNSEIPKSDLSCLRVCRAVYKGHEFIDVRTFVKNDAGEFIPTPKGVTFAPEYIHRLISALEQVNQNFDDSAET